MLQHTVKLLLKTINDFDLDLWKHSIFVMRFCYEFSALLKISEYEKENIIIGSLLHDIGKIKVGKNVLLKPGKLSFEEWQIMKEHPKYGQNILAKYKGTRKIIPLVLYHHERWDGKGYCGLKENKIPVGARIISIADAIEAMTSYRPYQEAKNVDYVYEELINNQGKQFDPFLIECILNSDFRFDCKNNYLQNKNSLYNLIYKCREIY